MKLLRFEKTANPIQWRQVYDRSPGLAERSYQEQLDTLCADMSQYAGAMQRTMTPLGYDVAEVYTDVQPLQRAWARENDVRWTPNWRKTIPLAQARAFRPDIVWSYDSRNLDFRFLAELKREVPSVAVITGFIGSASFDIETFRHYDFLLTCTDEFADQCRAGGVETYKVTHAFDADVLDHLDLNAPKTIEIVFSGALIRLQQHAHLEREAMLEKMADVPGVELYCPAAELSEFRDIVETTARRGVYGAQQMLRALGMSAARRRALPLIGKAATWKAMPIRQLNPRLRALMRPPRFGLGMYQLLRDAKVVIDCVATAEAANMRLFEATGAGSCLLTSWRPNLGSVFELDKEIVAYKSPDECKEKAQWLLDHPLEREQIAAAGQARTLRDYTYEKRAALLDELIRARFATRCSGATSSR